MKWKLLSIVVLLLACVTQAQAIEEMRPAINKLAVAVKEVMNKEGYESVSVGTFAGPATEAVPTGPGLKRILMQELQKLGIKVALAGAPMGVNAEFTTDLQTGNVKTTLKLSLSNGEPVKDIHSILTKEKANDFGEKVEKGDAENTIKINGYVEGGSLAELLGKNFDTDLKDGFIDPLNVLKAKSATVVGGDFSLRTSATSPFSMQILVNGTPAPIQLENNIPFVSINKGDSFSVMVKNNAPFDVAATILLDGINSFAVTEVRDAKGNPKYTRWIIAKGTSLELKGWHKTNSQVTKFVLTDLGESVAGQLGQVSEIGGISVKIQATWKEIEPRPQGEPEVYATALPESGIGEGERIEQVVVENKDKREYGIVRSVMVVRYVKPEPKPAE